MSRVATRGQRDFPMCDCHEPIRRAWKGWLPLPPASGETGNGPSDGSTHRLTEDLSRRDRRTGELTGGTCEFHGTRAGQMGVSHSKCPHQP